MTDARSKELVEMLRSMSGHVLWVDFKEAADELERLREALKPFAAEWAPFVDVYWPGEEPTVDINVPLAHCKRAAEVLK